MDGSLARSQASRLVGYLAYAVIPFTYLTVCLSFSAYVFYCSICTYMSVSVSVCVRVCASVRLKVSLSPCLVGCLSACVCVCLSARC